MRAEMPHSDWQSQKRAIIGRYTWLRRRPHKTSPGRQVHGGLALHLFDLLTTVESLPAREVDENDKQELKLGVAVLKFIDRAARREQRLFQRYLSEARSKRKKAL